MSNLTDLRRKRFRELIQNNYDHTFILSLEPAVNKAFAKGNISKIKLVPSEIPGVLKDVQIFNGNKRIEDSSIVKKIEKFVKQKKQAYEKNSDYYFKNRSNNSKFLSSPSSRKESLIHRSLGESL